MAKGANLMLDYVAYQMAQQRVADVARGALPDSPVRLPEIAGNAARLGTNARWRTAVAALLRRLADRCDVSLPARSQSGQGTTDPREAMNYHPCRPALNGIDA
jgi:hypothetical protein